MERKGNGLKSHRGMTRQLKKGAEGRNRRELVFSRGEESEASITNPDRPVAYQDGGNVRFLEAHVCCMHNCNAHVGVHESTDHRVCMLGLLGTVDSQDLKKIIG